MLFHLRHLAYENRMFIICPIGVRHTLGFGLFFAVYIAYIHTVGFSIKNLAKLPKIYFFAKKHMDDSFPLAFTLVQSSPFFLHIQSFSYASVNDRNEESFENFKTFCFSHPKIDSVTQRHSFA